MLIIRFFHFRQFLISSLFSPGSLFSWTVVFIYLLWSFLSLKIPAKTFLGPATPTGYVPAYSSNGVQYYLISLASYLVLVTAMPSLPLAIWHQFGQIISSLNIFSLVLCIFLLIKGGLFLVSLSHSPQLKLRKPLLSTNSPPSSTNQK